MATVPANLKFGKVTGQFLQASIDASNILTGDTDSIPQINGVTGTVTFSPFVQDVISTIDKVFILPIPVTANIDVNGNIIDLDSNQGVYLVASDSPAYQPVGFSWTAKFAFNGVSLPAFSFTLPHDTTLDLSSAAPISNTGGVATGIGPVGPQGPFGVQIANYGANAAYPRPTYNLNGIVTAVPIVYWVGNVGVLPTAMLATDLLYQS